MGELFGGILKALGYSLNAIYEVIPSYGIAIILLTIGVRLLLVPLTVKQIRSMTAMQKIQPQIKEMQKKFKGDRQKLNEELMKLYKEHGVNPLGGCLPLVAQMPVFIALFSVLRASIAVLPMTASLVTGTSVADLNEDQLKETICRPAANAAPTADGSVVVDCETNADGAAGRRATYRISDFRSGRNPDERLPEATDWISVCIPSKNDNNDLQFNCRSALGTGHLPRDGELFEDVTDDHATFLGMHLGCSATQSGSENAVKHCTADPNAGGGVRAIPYYLLVALIIATSYYQARQMAKRSSGQMAQQQMMMMKVMPVLFGFISLSIPAGTNVYFFVSNLWTIGQQGILFRSQQQAEVPAAGKGAKEPKVVDAVEKKERKPQQHGQRKRKGKR